MSISIGSTSYVIYFVAAMTVLLSFISVFHEYRKAKQRKHSRNVRPLYKRIKKVAVLISSKNGEQTIASVVRAAAANNCDVYVVSDGSTDKTVSTARKAGAKVLQLRKNVGKSVALYKGYKHFDLSHRYDAVAILDDDVIIEPDFISQAKKTMDGNCAVATGKNLTDWPREKRWNIWIASRAYGYWAYQLTLRTIQSSYNVMTCISGSNSLYRTVVLDHVLTGDTRFITEDTYWTLETHKLKLGTIKYSPKARAWLQDPTNFRDWYKQTLRWMWGTFQCIIAHRIGTQRSRFHLAFMALMLDWIIYIFSGPLALFIMWEAGLRNLPVELLLLCAGTSIFVVIAAIVLRIPRLILFIPSIVFIDFLFRWVMLHGLVKALRQRTVESCAWDSPKRFSAQLAKA